MHSLLKNMPEKVKIGAIHYRLEVMSADKHVYGDLLGEIDYKRAVIEVWPEVSPVVLADTVIHECLHGIFWHSSVNDEDCEEKFVTTGASGLVALWSDNPDLFKWVRSLIKEGKK